MFGTMGFSELIIILVIVLILFGSSRLPALGEGVGKALKGFKKAVHEEPPPPDPNAQPSQAPPPIEDAQVVAQTQAVQGTPAPAAPMAGPGPAAAAPGSRTVLAAYQPGPEATPGTTAAMIASAAPQAYQPKQAPPEPAGPAGQPAPSQGYPSYQPPTMEDRATNPAPAMRAQYPPLPPTAQTKPQAKRPSAIVNKDAVARVRAQQAALKAKSAQPAPAPSDMQHFGEGLGDALRTFRNAVNDVRSTVDPQMRTIQAEIDSAQKEIEQTVEDAKQMPSVQEEPPQKT
jgi:TatA/E family protein of Tat protein translocase